MWSELSGHEVAGAETCRCMNLEREECNDDGEGVTIIDGVGNIGRWSCYGGENHYHIQGRLATQSATTIVSLSYNYEEEDDESRSYRCESPTNFLPTKVATTNKYKC